MGNISYLSNANQNSRPESVEEAIFQLENSSTIFMNSWQRNPPDLQRAARVSMDAMTYLDHVVNEFLRARDTQKANGTYTSSSLKYQLDLPQGAMVAPVTRIQQQALLALGPGQGQLPIVGSAVTLEKLLNKIKHRHHTSGNFRIDSSERHVFLFNVDKPNQTPDAIVEFIVSDFCSHCRAVAAVL
jgi:hypothetical protein